MLAPTPKEREGGTAGRIGKGGQYLLHAELIMCSDAYAH
jgi:hypothetical protein